MARPFGREGGLNFDLMPILEKLLTDRQLMVDHGLLAGDAAASAGDLCRRPCRTRGLPFVCFLVRRRSAPLGWIWRGRLLRKATLLEGRERGHDAEWAGGAGCGKVDHFPLLWRTHCASAFGCFPSDSHAGRLKKCNITHAAVAPDVAGIVLALYPGPYILLLCKFKR